MLEIAFKLFFTMTLTGITGMAVVGLVGLWQA